MPIIRHDALTACTNILGMLSDYFLLNKIIKPIHRKLTENSEEIEVVYKKSCNEDELYNKIIENRKKDIIIMIEK